MVLCTDYKVIIFEKMQKNINMLLLVNAIISKRFVQFNDISDKMR